MVSRGEQKNKNGHLRRGCKGWPAARGTEDRCLRGTTGGRWAGRSGSKALTNPSSIIATGSSLLGLILHTPDQLVLLLEASIFIRNGEITSGMSWSSSTTPTNSQAPSLSTLLCGHPLLPLPLPSPGRATVQSWWGHCPLHLTPDPLLCTLIHPQSQPCGGSSLFYACPLILRLYFLARTRPCSGPTDFIPNI